MSDAVGAVALELRAWLRQAKLMTLNKRTPTKPGGDRVVVFVHGYMASAPVLNPLADFVAAETSLPTLSYSYRSNQSFEAVLRGFEEFVAKYADQARLHLVGHSLGGIIARAYAQSAPHLVDHVVTLATPHEGTAVASLALGPLRGAFSRRSSVIRLLKQGDASLDGIRLTCVAAGEDQLVRPRQSALSLPYAEAFWVDGVGHNALLYDVRTHEIVASAVARAIE